MISREKWYLVDGEHLAIGLLHLLELPQEIPARKQTSKHISPQETTREEDRGHGAARSGKETDQNLDLARTSLVAQSFMR